MEIDLVKGVGRRRYYLPGDIVVFAGENPILTRIQEPPFEIADEEIESAVINQHCYYAAPEACCMHYHYLRHATEEECLLFEQAEEEGFLIIPITEIEDGIGHILSKTEDEV